MLLHTYFTISPPPTFNPYKRHYYSVLNTYDATTLSVTTCL